MALALTLVALVIVGVLVAGALFSGTAEQRMAENTRSRLQAFGVAEGAAYGAIGTWPANRRVYTGRRAYPLDSGVPMKSDPSGSYEGTVYRLNGTLYLLDVTGRAGVSGVSQRLGVLVRIAPPHTNIQAALTVGEPFTTGGNAFLSGTDTPPSAGSNWSDCGPTGPGVAGVASPGDTNALYRDGSTEYVTLTRQASVQLSPGSYAPAPIIVDGVCETNRQPSNWGDGNDHASPCGAYSPIMWLKGDGRIVGGQGQGVLLVDGDLSLDGPFTFYGLVVVHGRLTAAGSAAVTVYGAVSAGSAALATSSRFTVNWSSCALTQALIGGGVATLSRSRGWVQLY
jgi:type II secretory pathway pseudopilin PulG